MKANIQKYLHYRVDAAKLGRDNMKFMKKIPGGFVIVPLIIGLLTNTFFPQVFQIGGPFRALLRDGNQAMMGLFLVAVGSSISIKEAGVPLLKGTLLLVLKLILGGAVAWLFSYFFGITGVLGLSSLALFSALPSNNSGLYLALTDDFGDETDAGAVSILALKNGPFGSMLVMGAMGQASIPIWDMLGILVPIIIGAVWGNLDKDFRETCKHIHPMAMFFLIFSIGAQSDISIIPESGMAGILLSLVSIAIGIVIHYIYNLFLKEKTPMGVAMGANAANSALTPALIAASDPRFEPYVASAAGQCATAAIITMLVMPPLVSFFNSRMIAKGQIAPKAERS